MFNYYQNSEQAYIGQEEQLAQAQNDRLAEKAEPLSLYEIAVNAMRSALNRARQGLQHRPAPAPQPRLRFGKRVLQR
ncbi:MAG: hypothetical protein HXY40_12155 [Chloroflexi bacterium]|nr:hypothetical protein [Chloroflexota bacterium]